MNKNSQFEKAVNIFYGHQSPEPNVVMVGYAALIDAYDLAVPLPDLICAIGKKYQRYQHDNWLMFSPKYKLEGSFFGHLVFALKYEGVNLGVLSALFKKLEPNILIAEIQLIPWGGYCRRIWFLYEWILDKRLDIPDIQDVKMSYVDVLDEKLQYPGPVRRSSRHRINNNLPGEPYFCPLIRRTAQLENDITSDLNVRAAAIMEKVHPDFLMRAAAFLLLQDSKASYAIEGEQAPYTRMERWGRAIGQAGRYALSDDEFLRLQQIVIEDFRFIHLGYRVEGGFIGEHDRITQQPIPEHISARHDDIYKLMSGLIQTDHLLKDSNYNAVLAAAAIAFGFVFIHPFEDGNGRIHRYLIHHVLAEKGFIPNGVIFPISYVILKHLKKYREILENFSMPRLKYIHWRPTARNNVEVSNDTLDLYRFFDATKQAEFLFYCIQETVETVFPNEIDYLKKHDRMKQFLDAYIELPDRLANLLIGFLQQNEGSFSKRAKEKEFSSLTEDEVQTIESKFKEIFYE